MTSPEIRGAHTTLRPAADADVDLLVAWFADPSVYAHWDGAPKSPAQVVAEGYTGGHRPATEPFIVEAAGEPVGYIQYCPDDATCGGIDLFLIPAARGRGLGPDAARALVRYLLVERGWRRVTVDPGVANVRAIRAWEKAGFVYQRDWPDHPDGPAVLMAIDARGPGETRASRYPTP